MPKDKKNVFDELDEQYGGAPFIMRWDHYNFNIEPDGCIVDIIFTDDVGVKIAIPICRKDAKMLRKHLKKLEQVLL